MVGVHLKVACLGAGYFSRFHIDAWQRQSRTSLVGVCDSVPAKAELTGAPAFNDLETMLDATRPDILDVIVPPPAHLASIRIAARKGVRFIVCQKPFCTSLDEARQAVDVAQSAGVELVVHENFRFQPWYRAIRSLIDNGDLGDVQQATFRLRTGDGRGESAYLARQPYFREMTRFLIHETGVHWIDTFRYLLGDPVSVYADLRRLNPAIKGEDAGYFILDFAGGTRALFDGNRHLDHASHNHRLTFGEAIIEGTQGTASLDGDGQVELRRFGERESHVVLPAKNWAGFAGDCVKALNDHLVNAIIDGATLENRARGYLRVLERKDALYASAEAGRKISVTLPDVASAFVS